MNVAPQAFLYMCALWRFNPCTTISAQHRATAKLSIVISSPWCYIGECFILPTEYLTILTSYTVILIWHWFMFVSASFCDFFVFLFSGNIFWGMTCHLQHLQEACLNYDACLGYWQFSTYSQSSPTQVKQVYLNNILSFVNPKVVHKAIMTDIIVLQWHKWLE